MNKVQITNKLALVHIEPLEAGDEIIAVECYFEFYDEECTAEINVDFLESEDPRFASIESPSEIHDSFRSSIEIKWEAIVAEVKKLLKELEEAEGGDQ